MHSQHFSWGGGACGGGHFPRVHEVCVVYGVLKRSLPHYARSARAPYASDAALKAGATDEAVEVAAEGVKLTRRGHHHTSMKKKKPQFRGGRDGPGARSRAGVGYVRGTYGVRGTGYGVGYGAGEMTAADVADAHFTHGVALQARYAAAQVERREDPRDLLDAAAAYR